MHLITLSDIVSYNKSDKYLEKEISESSYDPSSLSERQPLMYLYNFIERKLAEELLLGKKLV